MTTATASTLKLTKTERDTFRGVVGRLLTSESASLLDNAGEILGHGAGLSERELDLRDWGIAYGLAAGVLAVERPLADPAERAKAAHAIAVDVYTSWGTQVAARPHLGKAIDDALAALRAENLSAMRDALIDVGDAWGRPDVVGGDA